MKLLDYFWDGYDVCMFAYGQSGAGKSFSMTGTGPKCSQKWKGIIPRICADTFARAAAEEKEKENVSFKITVNIGELSDILGAFNLQRLKVPT